MDISNLPTNSAAVPATKTTGAVSASVPIVQGNSLPDAGQVRALSTKPLVDNSQDAAPVSQPNAEELSELVGRANEALQARLSDLKFTVDEGTDINIVRVEDSETGEAKEITLNEQVLAEYQHRLEEFCQNLRSFCMENGITYNRAITNIPIEDFVLKDLRRSVII